MKRKWMVAMTIVLVLAVALIAVGPLMSKVEQPDYQVIVAEGQFEQRRYQPMMIAEVSVSGERKQAIGQGFRQLADFIFGNNRSNQEISMTAPVRQQQSLTQDDSKNKDGWQVSFVMPAQYSKADLPVPNNGQVQITELPTQDFVAIRFSGSNEGENLTKHLQQLESYIQDKNLAVIGSPIYAFYNPPWTLPAMRRNEILMQLQ